MQTLEQFIISRLQPSPASTAYINLIVAQSDVFTQIKHIFQTQNRKYQVLPISGYLMTNTRIFQETINRFLDTGYDVVLATPDQNSVIEHAVFFTDWREKRLQNSLINPYPDQTGRMFLVIGQISETDSLQPIVDFSYSLSQTTI